MFGDCYKFDQYITNWDVSNVTNTANMFFNCINFNRNIDNWDVSEFTNMFSD